MRTSGKVLKEFESFRKALFDAEISHMAFMRDGKCKILYTQKYVDKLENEIERLQNIIKEVREYIKQSGQYLEDIKRFKVDVLEPNYLDILKILDKVGDEK